MATKEISSDKERVQKVIDALNKARSMELQAIHQYMIQHYTLSDLDYGKLAANIKLISIDEMDHAERFAERIKELKGEPTSALASQVVKGQGVRDIFPYDANLEDNTIATYNQLLAVCRENGDMISADIFQKIIDEEREHYTYFDNSRNHIDTLGDIFLANIAGTPSSTGIERKGFAAARKNG